MRNSVLSCLLAGACTFVSAQVTLPNTFTAGSPARAAEVNANFQALTTALNGLTTRVAKLEGQITANDLVGTYAVSQFQTELGGAPAARVAVYTGGGSVTLAANGTGSLIGNVELGHQLNLLGATLAAINRPQPPDALAWSYSGGTLNIDGGVFYVVAGGRLLIRSGTNPADGTNVLLLLTRTN